MLRHAPEDWSQSSPPAHATPIAHSPCWHWRRSCCACPRHARAPSDEQDCPRAARPLVASELAALELCAATFPVAPLPALPDAPGGDAPLLVWSASNAGERSSMEHAAINPPEKTGPNAARTRRRHGHTKPW